MFNLLNLDTQKFVKFIKEVQKSYQQNVYHNRLHAFDVTQTVEFFLKKCKFMELAKLNLLELASMYIASACHDIGHPGLTNVFMINTKSDLALIYNDKSVLENYHSFYTFNLLLSQDYNNEYNFLEKLPKKDFTTFREIFIELILSTDMSKHLNDVTKLKGRLEANDFSLPGKDKQMCMNMIVHCADISA